MEELEAFAVIEVVEGVMSWRKGSWVWRGDPSGQGSWGCVRCRGNLR